MENEGDVLDGVWPGVSEVEDEGKRTFRIVSRPDVEDEGGVGKWRTKEAWGRTKEHGPSKGEYQTMNDDQTSSTVVRDAALPTGSTSRPRGEEARGHIPSGKEDSPRALAKTPPRGASSTHPRIRGGEAASPPTAELDGQKALKIVRATARITVDIRESRGATDDEKAQTKATRRAVDDLLMMTTTAKNLAMRLNWRADSTWLDDTLASGGGTLPKKLEWSGRLYSYPKIRAAVPALASGVAATIQRAIDTKWTQIRYDVLVKQITSCPHFRVGQPIPLPSQAVKLAVVDGKYSISFSPYSRDAEAGTRRMTLPLVARDPFQESQLVALTTGQWRIGQVTIERDPKRFYRYYIRIAYTRLIERRKEGVHAAINRGMRCFVAAVTDTGEAWVYDGEDIEAYLKQVQRRRREYQYASKASDRWGHGRHRTLRPIERLSGQAERWRETRNQTIARRLARWLAARNVSTLYIEDFTGIRMGEPERLAGGKYVWDRIQEWPYYELGSRLTACLEEEGITTVVVPPQYISQRCPKCGEVRPAHADRVKWQLKCSTPRCGFRRHLDVAAALNVLSRGRASGGTKGG